MHHADHSACKLGSENTSWIRKYKYDKINRKIRKCDIFSIECKKLYHMEIHKILVILQP